MNAQELEVLRAIPKAALDIVTLYDETQQGDDEDKIDRLKKCPYIAGMVEDCRLFSEIRPEELMVFTPNTFQKETQVLQNSKKILEGLLIAPAGELETHIRKVENYSRAVSTGLIQIYNALNFRSRLMLSSLPSWKRDTIEALVSESTATFEDWKKGLSIEGIQKALHMRGLQVAKLEKTLKDHSKEVQDLGIRVGLLNKGVSIVERAQTFSSSARLHWWMKILWITLAAAMGAAMIFLVLPKLGTPPGDSAGEVASFVIQKLTLISVLSTLLIVFVRMFRVEAHNEIANRHRADALNTFDKFYNSGDNDETKRAVLIQAITAAFAPLDTGIAKSAPPATPVYDLPKLFADMAKSMTKGS